MCIMEQFDKATFAKVPLRLTGDPAHPVEVRPDANGDYRVGSSRIWRMGKKMLGTSVPWRFAHGKPLPRRRLLERHGRRPEGDVRRLLD